MIPVPGASFVYSLLKDIWSWGLPWFRAAASSLGDGRSVAGIIRMTQPKSSEIKIGYGIIKKLNSDGESVFECCKDAKSDEKYKQYKDAKLQVEGFDDLIREDLNELLARGDL